MSNVVYFNKNPKRRPRIDDEIIIREFNRMYPQMIAEYCSKELDIPLAGVEKYIRAAGAPTECGETYVKIIQKLGWSNMSPAIIEELSNAHWIYSDLYNEFTYTWVAACELLPPVYHGDKLKINDIRGCAFLTTELTRSAKLLFSYHDKESADQPMKELIINWEDIDSPTVDIDLYQST